LIQINTFPAAARSHWPMPTYLYKCPVTGRNVQGFVAEDVSALDEDTHEAVSCLACRQLHFVNPATGAVLGTRED
jgi:predicted nucleic acid-binding Zn ribbon protein